MIKETLHPFAVLIICILISLAFAVQAEKNTASVEIVEMPEIPMPIRRPEYNGNEYQVEKDGDKITIIYE